MNASPLFRLAVIGALAMSFALTACGRRGPLDPPPGYAERRAQQQAEQQAQATAEPTEDADGNPVQPKGQKKGFPLDWLLN